MNPMVRALRLLGRPKAEWVAIDAERPPPRRLLLQLVLPLGLLGTIVTLFVPMALAGVAPGIPGGRWIVSAIFGNMLIPTAMIGAAAFAAHGFATSVGADRDWTRGFVFAAFASTPYLLILAIGGLVQSPLGALIVFASMVYAVVLVYSGAPVMTGVPDDRVLPYTTAIVGFAAAAQYVGYGFLRFLILLLLR